MNDTRKLTDLVSIGPAMLADFRELGITKVSQLRGRDPQKLYDQLCAVTGMHHDICVLDAFRAAIEQANDPNLPEEKRQWFYWSKVRKGEIPDS